MALWRRIAVGIIIAWLFVAVCLQARDLGVMDIVSSRHIDAIPAALSVSLHGHPANYTQITDVIRQFIPNFHDQKTATINHAIADVIARRAEPLSSDYQLNGADDKGNIDFIRLAFALFGYRAESFVYLFYGLIGLSVVVFVARFWREPWALVFPAAYLAALLVISPPVSLDKQLETIITVRPFPVVSILACAHLIVAALVARSMWQEIPFALVQTAVIVLAIDVRSSAGWQVAPVVLAATISLCLIWRAGTARVRMAAVILPAVLAVVGLLGLKAYQGIMLADEYKRGEQIGSHVVWHSVAHGLAFNRALARDYGFRVDDMSIMQATRRYLVESGRGGVAETLGLRETDYSKIKYAPYDQEVRSLVLTICVARPLDCLEAMLVGKPLALLDNVRYFMGYGGPPTPTLQDPAALKQMEQTAVDMRERGRNADPLRPDALIPLLLLAGLVAVPASPRFVVFGAVALAVGAMAPVVLVYVVPHTVVDSLTGILTGLYVTVGVLAGLMVQAGVRAYASRRDQVGAAQQARASGAD